MFVHLIVLLIPITTVIVAGAKCPAGFVGLNAPFTIEMFVIVGLAPLEPGKYAPTSAPAITTIIIIDAKTPAKDLELARYFLSIICLRLTVQSNVRTATSTRTGTMESATMKVL